MCCVVMVCQAWDGEVLSFFSLSCFGRLFGLLMGRLHGFQFWRHCAKQNPMWICNTKAESILATDWSRHLGPRTQ